MKWIFLTLKRYDSDQHHSLFYTSITNLRDRIWMCLVQKVKNEKEPADEIESFYTLCNCNSSKLCVISHFLFTSQSQFNCSRSPRWHNFAVVSSFRTLQPYITQVNLNSSVRERDEMAATNDKRLQLLCETFYGRKLLCKF